MPGITVLEGGSPGSYVLFLKFGYNHGRDCYRLLDAETGRVASSRDVTWYYTEASCTTPVRPARIKPPRDIFVPMPKSVPVTAPSPAPAAAPLAPAPAAPPPPVSVMKPQAPISPRVGRDIKYEGNVEMPGRTRGETRAMRGALQDNPRLYQPKAAPRKAFQRCCKQSLIITPELNH